MKGDTVNWERVSALWYKRGTRLRVLEKALLEKENGWEPKELCARIGLNGKSEKSNIRTLQNDLNELRELYLGKQVITSAPYKLDPK